MPRSFICAAVPTNMTLLQFLVKHMSTESVWEAVSLNVEHYLKLRYKMERRRRKMSDRALKMLRKRTELKFKGKTVEGYQVSMSMLIHLQTQSEQAAKKENNYREEIDHINKHLNKLYRMFPQTKVEPDPDILNGFAKLPLVQRGIAAESLKKNELVSVSGWVADEFALTVPNT